MRKLVVGILAHVDAGKTTLSEAMLYQSGNIRKMGRVDHKDAFLDTDDLERERGITIFSKQAVMCLDNLEITLLDTPGHVDFSIEMERTLQVLDYAILVINGADGVQGHTQTLWQLLQKYNIPVFLFVNKMDQRGTDKNVILKEIRKLLHENCIDFEDNQSEDFWESIAVSDEMILEKFLETNEIEKEDIKELIIKRKIFPCFFGSALKLQGVEEFLQAILAYTQDITYPEEFGAKVFKVVRDEQGNRLTYMKITGGNLKTKALLTDKNEKVNQIRIYSGVKYEAVNEVKAGSVCAVVGLTSTFPGEGLGIEQTILTTVLEPVLTYKVQLPEDCEVNVVLPKLREIEEEEPELHIVWNEKLQEIQMQIMGEVQIEVLKDIILKRFGIEVGFGNGNIMYKETIADIVEGVGHFEPLRHYAEVHLILEPLERGSGLQFVLDCSEDLLDKNWQRLILTHLEEKEYIGVLTGSPITDMRIRVVGGRAHTKHTEGGDFRQATYRAVRQGLMQAQSVLLEPYYKFRLEVPENMIGRAMTDIERIQGNCNPPKLEGQNAVLEGSAPVIMMQNYQKEVTAYTKGQGHLFCSLKGYEICHNSEAVIIEKQYNPDADIENPSSSVFCSNGAGFIVEWDEISKHMHGDSLLSSSEEKDTIIDEKIYENQAYGITADEVDEILNRTFNANKKKESNLSKGRTGKRVITAPVLPSVVSNGDTVKKLDSKKEYLLVDGYNIIFAWKDLSELASVNVNAAREKLMDILCNYQALRRCDLILVFDAYKVEGHQTEIIDYHNIHIVYTKEAETADQYIEKFAHENGRQYRVTVATSDGLEQVIIRGQGCNLLSAREFYDEIHRVNMNLRAEYLEKQQKIHHYPFNSLTDEVIKDKGGHL